MSYEKRLKRLRNISIVFCVLSSVYFLLAVIRVPLPIFGVFRVAPPFFAVRFEDYPVEYSILETLFFALIWVWGVLAAFLHYTSQPHN